ncbi:MAG: hypothetical protein JSU07_02410 [Bacteroidetes bacterium]|nr:hypothetical protein [Bacteroidota bacterium]
MVQKLTSKNILNFIIHYRKLFIKVLPLTFVATYFATFLIAKQYKSTSVIFAARHFSTSKLLIEQNVGNQEDYMQLGDGDDVEKVIQILNTDELKLEVAKRLNLRQRWNLKDTTFALHFLKLKWEEMISIKRTDFNAIKVEAYDYTANNAAQLANTIVSYIDTVRFKMYKEVADKALKIVSNELIHTEAMIKELDDSLQALREIGVLDYKKEVEAYSKAYAKVLGSGNSKNELEIEKKLNVLKKYGGNYLSIEENLKKYRFKYPILKAKYDEALVNSIATLPIKFVVEHAIPNEYKAKPSRVIISSIITASTFIALLLYLLFTSKPNNLFKKDGE